MFRPLRDTLRGRTGELERQKTEAVTAEAVIRAYMTEEFGAIAQGFDVRLSYTADTQQLTIIAGSKSLASELMLRAGELGTRLRQRGINVKQIAVR